MKAIVFNQSLPIEQPNALFETELETPVATGTDLLVNVQAVSINPVDSKIRLGSLPEKGDARVLGFDAVGTITAIGEQVSLFNVGDTVFYAGDITRPGTNAEYQLVDERIVGLAPNSISKADAAALPLTTITAYEMLFDRLHVDYKNRFNYAPPIILITGGAGGVGSAMIQLAKALIPEAVIIATASRAESQAWCKKMGADHVISHAKKDGGIYAQLQSIGIKQVSHIASLTHTAEHFDDYIEAIKPQGKICLIDDPDAPLNIKGLKLKSISLHWELMFTRSRFETDDMIKQHHILNKVSELVDNGKIISTATENLGEITVDNLKTAHAMVEKGDMIGKVVLANK
jgi:zinc-binding alcohol dehydrogenase family protein